MHTSAQVVNRKSIDLLCIIFAQVGGVGIFADTTDSFNWTLNSLTMKVLRVPWIGHDGR